MSLEVALDKATFSGGDTVSGKVRVIEDIPKSRSLTVGLWWDGRRFVARDMGTETLVEGPVRAGDEYRFELTVPPDAIESFQGHAHNVNWYVWATADVPWAIDPKFQADIVIEPLTVQTRDDFIDLVPTTEEDDGEMGLITKVLIWTFLGPILLALGLVLLPFVLIYWVPKHGMIRTRIRDYELEIREGPVLKGEWLPFTLSFTLRRPVELDRLEVALVGKEKWETGSGKNRRTHYHTFHEQKAGYLSDTYLAPDPNTETHTFRFEDAVHIPEDVLPSVKSSVFYTLSARLYLKGWPDPSAEVKPTVVSASLEHSLGRPAQVSPEETSEGVYVIPKGEPAPAGVDLRAAHESVWPPLLITLAGFGLAVGGFLGGLPAMYWNVGAGFAVGGALWLALKLFK